MGLANALDVSKLEDMAVITRLIRGVYIFLDVDFARPKVDHIVPGRELLAHKQFLGLNLLFEPAFHDLIFELRIWLDSVIAVPLHEPAEGGFDFFIVLSNVSVVFVKTLIVRLILTILLHLEITWFLFWLVPGAFSIETVVLVTV